MAQRKKPKGRRGKSDTQTFILRCGSRLHRLAAQEAHRQGVSLNEYITRAVMLKCLERQAQEYVKRCSRPDPAR